MKISDIVFSIPIIAIIAHNFSRKYELSSNLKNVFDIVLIASFFFVWLYSIVLVLRSDKNKENKWRLILTIIIMNIVGSYITYFLALRKKKLKQAHTVSTSRNHKSRVMANNKATHKHGLVLLGKFTVTESKRISEILDRKNIDFKAEVDDSGIKKMNPVTARFGGTSGLGVQVCFYIHPKSLGSCRGLVNKK